MTPTAPPKAAATRSAQTKRGFVAMYQAKYTIEVASAVNVHGQL